MITRSCFGAVLVSLLVAGCAASTEDDEQSSRTPSEEKTSEEMPAVKDVGTEPNRARCKVYSQEEWGLLTGQNSPYGGTWCYR